MGTHVKAQPCLQKSGTKTFVPPAGGGFAAMEKQLSRQPSRNFHSKGPGDAMGSKNSCMGANNSCMGSKNSCVTGQMSRDQSMIGGPSMADTSSVLRCPSTAAGLVNDKPAINTDKSATYNESSAADTGTDK